MVESFFRWKEYAKIEDNMDQDNDQINKPSLNDWRRQGQERYLFGVKLIARDYHPYNSGWDHDHCEFCGIKFSLFEGDLGKGYSTEDEYHWICNQCFDDFKYEFAWQLENDISSER